MTYSDHRLLGCDAKTLVPIYQATWHHIPEQCDLSKVTFHDKFVIPVRMSAETYDRACLQYAKEDGADVMATLMLVCAYNSVSLCSYKSFELFQLFSNCDVFCP
jgi:hypothetical protein